MDSIYQCNIYYSYGHVDKALYLSPLNFYLFLSLNLHTIYNIRFSYTFMITIENRIIQSFQMYQQKYEFFIIY